MIDIKQKLERIDGCGSIDKHAYELRQLSMRLAAEHGLLQEKLRIARALLQFIKEEDLLPMAFAMEGGKEVRDVLNETLGKMEAVTK